MPLLVNSTQGHIMARNVERANTEVARTVGFLTKSRIGADDGIWFPRCSLIHTFGMRTRVDVIFIDDGSRVLRVIEAAAPWRIYSGGTRAAHAIELAPGSVARGKLHLGDVLTLDDANVARS
ncbi:MAG: DUF192 domain-containing protein [Candidatus Baltobacteraceae bacterium]